MTMDTNPDHLDDETLSALLDGASDGASADAAAHLGACDRCAERQAELSAARAALAASPVEPLDELARRRLVAAAVRAADDAPAGEAAAGAAVTGRTRWAQRHPAVLGSVAAALLAVLVGVPFVVGNHGGGSAEKSLSAAPNAAREEAGGVFLGDLGDLTDRDRLRLRLTGGTAADSASAGTGGAFAPSEPAGSAAGGATPSAAAVPSAAPASGGLAGSAGSGRTLGPGSPGAPAPAAATPTNGGVTSAQKSAAPTPPAAGANSPEAFASDQPSARDRADADACVAALLKGPARGGRLTGSGVGTWRGRPAVVAAFKLSGGTVAFVTDRSGCAVLDRFAL